MKKLFEIRLKDETFQNEVRYLMGIKHQHIVQLVGYCAESTWEAIEQPSGSGNHIFAEIPKRLFCFEYVCNKGLDKYISGTIDYQTIYMIYSYLFVFSEVHFIGAQLGLNYVR